MIDPLLALQTAIETVLRADAGVETAFGDHTVRLYDRVPEARGVNIFPYITLGENDQAVDDSDGCNDTAECYVQVDVWSRGVGKTEVKTIGQAVLEALDGADAITAINAEMDDFRIITCRVDRLRYGREPDMLTERCNLVLRYGVAPVT